MNFVKKLKDSRWKSIFSLNSVDTFGDVCRSIWAIYNQWPLVLHWRGLQEPLQQHIYPFPLKYPSAAKLWAGNEDIPLSKLLYIHLLDFHSKPLKRVGGNPLPILVQSPIELHMYKCTVHGHVISQLPLQEEVDLLDCKFRFLCWGIGFAGLGDFFRDLPHFSELISHCIIFYRRSDLHHEITSYWPR